MSTTLTRTTTAWLLVLIGSLYLLTASGQVQTIDAEQELSVAASIRAGRGVTSYAPQGRAGGTRPGRHGGTYAAHDVGSTVLFLPLTLVPGTVQVVDGQACWPPGTRSCTPVHDEAVPTARLEVLASFVNPVLGALTMAAFASLLACLGLDSRSTVITTLLVAFTSIVWVYSHISFDATATALFVTLAVLQLARFERGGRSEIHHLALAGAALAAAIVVRSDSLALAPALSVPAVAAAWDERRRGLRAVRALLAWGGPVAAGLAVNGWYNWLRFGSPLRNGNLDDPLLDPTTPVWEGLLGQTVSPGKGMLFYSPLLVAALFGWRRFLRRHRRLALTVLAVTASALLAHAPLADWSGDEAWGARHTVVVIALVMVPLGFVVSDALRRRLPRRGVVGLVALASVGLVVQLSGVLSDYRSVNVAREGPGVVAANDMRRFQAVDGLRAVARAARGDEPYAGPHADAVGPVPVPKVDLWWAREWANERNAAVATLGPLLLVALAAVATRRLRGTPRSSGPSTPPAGGRSERSTALSSAGPP